MWTIQNRYKKHCEERMFFENPEGKRVTVITGYRYGNFSYLGEGKPKVDTESTAELLMDSDWMIDGMYDGWFTDYEFSEDISEEEQNEIIDRWEEDSFEGLEELGYEDTFETEFVLIGPFDLEEELTEEEKANVD